VIVSQTAARPSRPLRKTTPVAPVASLAVSAYDHAASLIISLLVLVGCGVFCLLMAWLSSGIFRFEKSVPVVMEELASGGGYENGVGTEGQHIEAPTESEIAAESDIMDDETPDTLSEIVDATVSSEASLDRFDMQFARGEGVRTGGRSEGTGKHPAKGTGGGFGGGAARQTAWEIRFPPGNTVETYAKQLDGFGIELGVFGGANEIVYISKLTQPKPATRTGQRTADGRKYMTWSRGDLDEADQELLNRAGINPEGRTVFKFLPPEIESQLATLERQFKNRASKDIRRTRFGVKPDGQKFVFYVIDQTYY
jgi:hypothetical protein